MAINIPIITEFNGKGIQKAIKQFKQLETNGQKAMFVLKNGAKAAAAGFLAVGAAVGAAAAIGLDLVKAAAEDAKSQRQLALALKTSTHARDADIKANEKWIDTTSRALGIADDKLRPALARLVRSTKDAKKGQDLLNLALNISAATSKPLENVVAALGRAYDGNNTALGRLGLGLDKATLKGKSFADIQGILERNFSGAAASAANSYEGRMARLKVRFQELKESLGKPLLDAFNKVLDAVFRITDAFGKDGLQGAIRQAKNEMNTLLYDQNGRLNSFGKQLNTLITVLNGVGRVTGGTTGLIKDIFSPHTLGGISTSGGYNPALANNYGMKQFAPYIGAGAVYGNLRGVATGRGSGTTNYNFYIQSGVGDPVAIGRNVKNVLTQFERRSGGK